MSGLYWPLPQFESKQPDTAFAVLTAIALVHIYIVRRLAVRSGRAYCICILLRLFRLTSFFFRFVDWTEWRLFVFVVLLLLFMAWTKSSARLDEMSRCVAFMFVCLFFFFIQYFFQMLYVHHIGQFELMHITFDGIWAHSAAAWRKSFLINKERRCVVGICTSLCVGVYLEQIYYYFLLFILWI